MDAVNSESEKTNELISQVAQREQVLVIDDSPEILVILKAILRSKYDVITHLNAESIIKTIELQRPNIILLDIHMPNVDGFGVIAQIKRHPLFDDLAIIVMSGDASEKIRSRVSESGAVGFLHKPFEIKSLAAHFAGIIDGLNSSVSSASGKKTWHNFFAVRDKKKALNEYVRTAVSTQRKILLLTWDDPENYLAPDLLVQLRSNNISFMQFKPSLIPRFPFIHGFTGVIDELMKLSHSEDGVIDIIIDEPMTFFRTNEEEASLKQVLSFLREIEFRASKLIVLHVGNKDNRIQLYSSKLAKDFIA